MFAPSLSLPAAAPAVPACHHLTAVLPRALLRQAATDTHLGRRRAFTSLPTFLRHRRATRLLAEALERQCAPLGPAACLSSLRLLRL